MTTIIVAIRMVEQMCGAILMKAGTIVLCLSVVRFFLLQSKL